MSNANKLFTPNYRNFQQAQQQLADIMPIDYFAAKTLVDDFQAHFDTEHEYNELLHVLIALGQSLRAGHNCLPLANIACTRFGYRCDEEGIVECHGFNFSSLDEINRLLTAIPIQNVDGAPIVLHRDCLYFRRYFVFENELERAIRHRQKVSVAAQANSASDINEEQHLFNIKQCINELFPQTNESEIDWQKIAVANAINKPFCVIAGGPGTGKTYTVTKLLAALVMLHQQKNVQAETLRIGLVAPTGKAAQRLSESIINATTGFRGQIDDNILDAIPSNAHTLHRLLGVIPNSPNFRHNEENKLALDILLIDEVSMVDVAMMARVMRALPPRCKVILLGDADQLPSVAAGSVLADLAPRPHLGFSRDNRDYLTQVTGQKLLAKYLAKGGSCEGDHVTFLTKSRRFDGEGAIGKIAANVIAGEAKTSWQFLVQNERERVGDFADISLVSTELKQWLPTLVEHYFEPIAKSDNVRSALGLLAKFRVLCATRQGDSGVAAVNDYIRQLLGKNTLSSTPNLYHGQPIMINENDYRLSLYNGDIGMLWRNDAGHLMAVFESSNGELHWVLPSRLPSFETVYAMTIHKTQGSEFEHVAMVLPTQKDNRLLSRELLYTGITRAKNKLTISSYEHVWRRGVESQVTRHSGFRLVEK